mmetsp:Transcript_69395/g.77616  ORF Transcript_69395/g.77616 Transcript_69395/m.77616 type:complete len:352 (-) Transcript_69395:95-1150(-)
MDISLQIPVNAEPGDSLSFDVNGQNFSIEVPVASVPGETIVVKLANSSREGQITERKAEDATDDDNIIIEMATGSSIIIQTTTKNIGPSAVSDKSLSDGTYRLLWPACRYIVDFVNSPEFRRQFQDLSVHSVIELGAGHGLLGMAFAEIVSSFPSTKIPMELVLSDVEEALPQLEANIHMNSTIFGRRIIVSSIPLKWHSHPILNKTNGDIDFIVGSDLLYNIEAIPLLAATIRRLLSKSTKILLSIRWRKPSEERTFFLLLSDILEWKVIHGACSLDYRAYGNGSESDKYFSQNMVGIAGKVVPLSSIDESCIEQMTTQEFEQYERLQTQVYLGEVVANNNRFITNITKT